MPITIELIKQGRVALQTYSDPLVMRDLETLNDTMGQEILPSAEGKIHILADFRLVRHPPIFLLARGASLLDRTHPNTGTIVGILESALVYRMGLMFATLMPKHPIILVRSMDEAISIIDDLLAPEPPNSSGSGETP
jgi:hypothetical protein